MKGLKRFIRDEAGMTAVLFGLALIPIAGLAGAAVDYGRAVTLRAGLQKAADETALATVIADHAGRSIDVEKTFKAALGPTASAIMASASGSLSVTGTWLVAGKEYQVTASGPLDGTLVHSLLPGRTMDVGVRAAAIGSQIRSTAKIASANLDPEAADYNETQAYCYDDRTKNRLGPLDPDTGKRKAFVKIADNTDEGVKAPPANVDVVCGDGEQVSFLVKNIREARTSKAMQASGTPRYFYTDAVKQASGLVTYSVTYDGLTRDTLETILCPTKDQCKPRGQGGVLPNNHETGRTPSVNAKVCKAGEFIYFGWEDRIPGVAGDNSDRDFDDIRMFITCPTETVGPFTVRLSA